MFAQRTDLLTRSNLRILAQVAVPADMARLDEAVLRAGLMGEPQTDLDEEESVALDLALIAVDMALDDASQLIIGYGVAEATTSPLLTRAACDIAVYFLHVPHGQSKESQAAYDAARGLLSDYAKGRVQLSPPTAAGPIPDSGQSPADDCLILTSPRRYGRSDGGLGQ